MKPPTDLELRSWLSGLINKHSEGDLTAFAKRYKLNRSAVSLMVNGKRKMSDKSVVRIASRTGAKPPTGFTVYEERNELQQEVAEPTSVPIGQFEEVVTLLKSQMRLTISALDRLDQQAEKIAELTEKIGLLLGREERHNE